MAEFVLKFVATDGTIKVGKYGPRPLAARLGQYLKTANPNGYYASEDITEAFVFDDERPLGGRRNPRSIPAHLEKVKVNVTKTVALRRQVTWPK